MNKKVLLSMGLPVTIRNSEGKKATIELNKGEFVICRYHPNNSCYLNDAKLEGWYPANIFKRIIYRIKKSILNLRSFKLASDLIYHEKKSENM